MKNEENQTVGFVVSNLRNAEIIGERAKGYRDRIRGKTLLKGTPEVQLFEEACRWEAEASTHQGNAMNVNGADDLKILCEKEPGGDFNPKFLKQLIADFAYRNKKSLQAVNDMLVVDFVKKIKKEDMPKSNKILYTISTIIILVYIASFFVVKDDFNDNKVFYGTFYPIFLTFFIFAFKHFYRKPIQQ